MIASIIVFIRRGFFLVLCNVVNVFRRQRRSVRNQLLLILILIVILVVLAVHNAFISSKVPFEPVTRDHLQQYCNFPINKTGMEGILPFKAMGKFKLESVQILIRHGDRSPIYRLEGIKVKELDCSMNPSNSDAKKLFLSYRKSLNYIKTRSMSPGSRQHLLSSISEVCEYNGQLSQKGFQQSLETGQFLRKAYSDLEVKSASSVHARSTDYDRTAQTVAAVISGFLGENAHNIGQISINITKDTYFREEDVGVISPCPSVEKSKMSNEYLKGLVAMEPLMQELSDMMMVTRKSLPGISFITDYPLAYFCHGVGPPCARNGCISEEKTFQMLTFSNWHFNAKYKQFHEALSLPVLTQIGTRMLTRRHSNSSIKLAIYGGHESSIIPVLQALGAFNRRWIPYASRLVFELWSRRDNSQKGKDGKYVRVLFNGESITYKLAFCKWYVVHDLCPLGIFLDWIGGGHFENAQNRYNYLCNVNRL